MTKWRTSTADAVQPPFRGLFFSRTTLRSVLFLLATLGAQGLRAATIVDVSDQVSLSLRTGDTLAFEIRSGSFEKNALAFGLPIYPTEISFALVVGPLLRPGSFSASLGPLDGGVSVDFAGPLGFQDGSLSAGGLRSAIYTLQGDLDLSPQLSQEIFAGGTTILRLRNDGPDVTIGLDPYTMRQDLFMSLASGPMTVGGIVDSATLESSGGLRAVSFANAERNDASAVPEPASSGLFWAGGIILCMLSTAMARVPKGRK
jgi:hypothetical protein